MTFNKDTFSTGAASARQRKMQAEKAREVFVHVAHDDTCAHDFQGWREFDDGRGGERVCAKCGMGAMEHTLRYSDF